MGKRGEIYTTKLEVANGKRSYFFNVKENRKGDFFMSIVESISRLDNKFDRQEVLVYCEHIDEFRKKIDEAIYQLKALSSDDNSFPKIPIFTKESALTKDTKEE